MRMRVVRSDPTQSMHIRQNNLLNTPHVQNLLHVIRQKGRASQLFTKMVIETCAAAGT
jgi:hypothetical protein